MQEKKRKQNDGAGEKKVAAKLAKTNAAAPPAPEEVRPLPCDPGASAKPTGHSTQVTAGLTWAQHGRNSFDYQGWGTARGRYDT